MAYIKQACNSIAQKVADGKAPPRKASGDGDGGWLCPREIGFFKEVASKETGAAHRNRIKPPRRGTLVRRHFVILNA
jgi:hypothetical protein